MPYYKKTNLVRICIESEVAESTTMDVAKHLCCPADYTEAQIREYVAGVSEMSIMARQRPIPFDALVSYAESASEIIAPTEWINNAWGSYCGEAADSITWAAEYLSGVLPSETIQYFDVEAWLYDAVERDEVWFSQSETGVYVWSDDERFNEK